ncbi:LOW QUALITY PROTEIN: uncharacterized protein with HEPN domain [Marinobacter sp. LV10MA510-1]|nr:LOW QUALITY PROTEIN: uncharacterized protein with HEPN domain [Marinobacter sp. LV10MA510-1]
MNVLRTADYLEHIVNSSGDILSFTGGFSREAFKADLRTQKAVVMSLIEIGEAATKIAASDPDFIAKNNELPWSQMRGMRNRIAHGYFDIDLDIVWQTAVKAIPDLNDRASRLLKELREVL